jgi:hypothetical protein
MLKEVNGRSDIGDGQKKDIREAIDYFKQS